MNRNITETNVARFLISFCDIASIKSCSKESLSNKNLQYNLMNRTNSNSWRKIRVGLWNPEVLFPLPFLSFGFHVFLFFFLSAFVPTVCCTCFKCSLSCHVRILFSALSCSGSFLYSFFCTLSLLHYFDVLLHFAVPSTWAKARKNVSEQNLSR